MRAGNAIAPMEATGIEQPASAARDALGIAMSAFPALLLLITMVGLSMTPEIVEEPASRGTLVLNLAASAATMLLNPIVRPTVLAEVARARSAEESFAMAHQRFPAEASPDRARHAACESRLQPAGCQARAEQLRERP